MKKDIEIPKVEGIHIAIIPSSDSIDEDLWQVYIINTTKHAIDTILITSKGYGEKEGQKQHTALMRRNIERLPPSSFGTFEAIHSSVFHLTNEYFVTFYKDGVIHDKNYIFLPETIITQNLTLIPVIEKKGILHS
jgi:hypothetical protein